jgi:hypothetical protein
MEEIIDRVTAAGKSLLTLKKAPIRIRNFDLSLGLLAAAVHMGSCPERIDLDG